MATILNQQTSIIDTYLSRLRDLSRQQNSYEFKQNIERLGMFLGYEISKQLTYQQQPIQTPLATAQVQTLQDEIVIATILRAGLPVQQGIHTVLDTAELTFIAAGRKPDISAGVEIDLAYVAASDLGDKVLIIADTMLATGQSIVDAYNALIPAYGQPSKVIIAAVIASQAGVTLVQSSLPAAELFICAMDPELNDEYFIVPGLGDAGDLLYGPKQTKKAS